MNQETVFVGLSGGVDSSVAAYRLLKRGYRVVGVFIKVWQPDWLVCDWERDRLDAMRVAAHLDIPFLTCDAETVYKRAVADYMIQAYQAGLTPNPDVMCNRYVKFGAFLDFARAHGADKIATGHYARIGLVNNKYELQRGIDTTKDQSYFLWTLTDAVLAQTLFPVGDSLKSDIRAEAKAAGLPTFAKRDSQGICFLGQIDMKEFLGHYSEATPGPVVDTNGTVIGQHDGALYYTVGQRHGFSITNNSTSETPLFILNKNLVENSITVGPTPPSLKESYVVLSDINLLGGPLPKTLEVQFRYRQRPLLVTVEHSHTNEHVILTPQTSDHERPALGQSCVFYEGARCRGGGIIVEIH